MAASSTSAFMTVASMPMASAVGRDKPSSEIWAPRRHIAAADHDAEADAERVSGDQIGGKAIDRRLMNAELFGTAERFAGELDDHPSIFRLRHEMFPPRAFRHSPPKPAQRR